MSKRAKSPVIGKAVRVVIEHKRLRDVREYEDNPRIHPEKGSPEWERLRASLVNDYFDPLVWNRRNNKLVSGHLRRKVLIDLGVESADMVRVSYDDATHRARVVAANEQAGAWDDSKLRIFLKQMVGGEIPAELSGLTDERIRQLLDEAATDDGQPSVNPKLQDRFGVPPFSILDARQGYWQERKRAWLALGIQSEVGRGDNLLKFSNTVLQPDKGKRLAKTFGTEGNVAGEWTGTSIFDPVLCELAYRWFCGPGGTILDPFAGGSVRGVVAGMLGRDYVGIDLRDEQVAANRQQWEAIKKLASAKAPAKNRVITNPLTHTPIESVDEFFFKRDDHFEFGGANGGKVRAMLAMCKGAKGIVTCGDRESTQIPRAAMVAKALGIPCRLHTAVGLPSDGMIEATAYGAEVVQWDPGYLNVCKKRAKDDAEAQGYKYVPWGLEDPVAVSITSQQTIGMMRLPVEFKRLVVPVGSGMTLAGILHGIAERKFEVPVLGVMLGAEVEKRLDQYAPKGWRKMVKLVKAKQPYHSEAPAADQLFHGVPLDPVYEAKCVPFMEPGDLLWIVGRRTQSRPALELGKAKWLTGDSRDVAKLTNNGQFDLIFSCPPYFDLEVYSEKANDLSRAESYADFVRDYRKIISGACGQLKDNRFACFVVGDIRDKKGNYRNFVSDTIAAFRDAGLDLYNEGILITSVGSLALRVGKQFVSSRKMGKAHQNVLVFVKGDARKATEAMGPVEFGDIETSGFAEAAEVESPAT